MLMAGYAELTFVIVSPFRGGGGWAFCFVVTVVLVVVVGEWSHYFGVGVWLVCLVRIQIRESS
jgi:hypothetical protein